MIDAKSLRIGNTVEYCVGDHDIGWVATSIGWQHLKWLTQNPKDFNKVHHPIHLTEKLLLERGFTQDSPSQNFIHPSLKFYRIFELTVGVWHIEHIHCENPEEWVAFMHLHWLENFFQIITGEELKPIKL